MADNLPRGRQKNVTGQGAGVHRRGSGTGAGPVGSGSSMSSSGAPGPAGGGKRSGGRPSLLTIIIILAVMMMGGGGALTGLLGGGGAQPAQPSPAYTQQSPVNQPQTTTTQPAQPAQPSQSVQQPQTTTSTGTGSSSSGYNSLSSLFGGYSTASAGSASSGWVMDPNTGSLNSRVSADARGRYTQIKGDGTDTFTIMVYMCGTDLESRSGMATNDLMEMTKATIGSNVNLIVYTGGCRAWKNNVISSRTNEIYQIQDGGLKRLGTAGAKPMTDPATLTEFIKFCGEKFPANRTALIFWDHGGGSITGYGYDEKFSSSGSMNLAGINSALKNAGLKYDFIGFDTCLMATIETALVLDQYADYMIASEETEPGVGWYYTNWLTELSKNTSMPTIEIGKKIVDDFVDVCERSCPGQGTTLSVVDLAELGQTVPAKFSAFSSNTTEKIRNDEYKEVSDARYLSREFAKQTGIDQIDLINFANNVGSEEANQLVQALLSAVKYNRTGRSMTNAYGLSVYFPYRKTSTVSKAVKTYQEIGLDEEYTRCIREFASMEVSGQVASGSGQSPIPSLLGGGLGGGSSTQSQEQILQLLSTFLGSGGSGLSSSDLGFFDRSIMEDEHAMGYLAANQFDPGQLTWTEEDGKYKIILSDDQKKLVQQVDLNMYVDDGEGYVDLGLDASWDVDEEGNLVADPGETWLSINNQPVAYYHVSTIEDGDDYKIMGYVPAMLNDERVQLILLFTDEQPEGYIAGAQPVYEADQTETVSRGLIELQPGDKLDFLCDFYSYSQEFQDSYYLGEPMTVTDNMVISDTLLGDQKTIEIYRFTDIYNNNYWTEFVPR